MNIFEINVTPSMRECGLVFTAVTSEQNSFNNLITTRLDQMILDDQVIQFDYEKHLYQWLQTKTIKF